MRIRGIEHLSREEFLVALSAGGRFILFEYCISLIFLTARRPSAIYFVHGNDIPWAPCLGYTLLSCLLGWWGVPWGVIYTPLVLVSNLAGGCDVTEAVWPRTEEELDQLWRLGRSPE